MSKTKSYEALKKARRCVKCTKRKPENGAVVCVFCAEIGHYWRGHKAAGTKYPGVEAFARTTAGKAAEEGKRTHTAPATKKAA